MQGGPNDCNVYRTPSLGSCFGNNSHLSSTSTVINIKDRRECVFRRTTTQFQLQSSPVCVRMGVDGAAPSHLKTLPELKLHYRLLNAWD